MKTKIIYVLVSGKEDFYLEQTLISVYSCRMHNSEANITIVLDKDTNKSLKGSRAEIKKYVSEVIVVDIPIEYDSMQKSRYIKTNLRKIVSGDFLYIDSDTVIADSLSDIDDVDAEIAAVYDSNRNLLISNSSYVSDTYINSHTKRLGWPSVIGHPNYNGGVMFARDCPLSHEFYCRWFELWVECTKKGTNIDMAALCRTNIELGECIKELPGIWNCQIQRQGLPLLPEAKIIHCFTGGNVSFYELCSERILTKIKCSGTIDEEIGALIADARNAFMKSTVVISSDDAQILEFPIIKLRSVCPMMFKVFNKIASLLIRQ